VNNQIVYGAPQNMPTQPWQQRDMLVKRGVPAEVKEITSLGQLRELVGGGQRPVLVGLLMSQVPNIIKDHTFDGWHAVAVEDWGWQGGTRGFWLMDPNFHPPSDGYRIDPDHGKKFYPDWVMQAAMLDSSAQAWAVVPDARKFIPDTRGRGRLKVGGALRTDKITNSSTTWARAKRDGFTYRIDGKRLWTNAHVYYFFGWDRTRKWARVSTASGRRFFIRRDEFAVVRWP
jgi:hypothetical protein